MQPLLLMKQTLEAAYDPGVLLLDGPNVRFTSSNQILSAKRIKHTNNIFKVSFQFKSCDHVFFFKENNDFGFDIEHQEIDYHNNFTTHLSEATDINHILQYMTNTTTTFDPKTSKILTNHLAKDRFLLEHILVYKTNNDTFSFVTSHHDIETLVYSAIHLPGLRGNPERTYKTSRVDKIFPGTFEHYAASVLRYWQLTKSHNTNILCNQLKFLGIAPNISAIALDATQVEISVGRLLEKKQNVDEPVDLVNIADVGVGVSQVLPVLVALLAAAPGQLVYIEQPEIHLHPLAQYKLAAIIAEASKRGVLVVIETHSDILIRGVQTLVAKGELDPAIVKLHWFSRSPEDGSTTVTCAELDETGSFGDWPQDFDTTALLTEKAYLDAVEERLSRNEK